MWSRCQSYINENLRESIEDILFNATLRHHSTNTNILGRRGMDIVVRAYDTLHALLGGHQYPVVPLTERALTVSRFLRETPILKLLNHPGAVLVVDAVQARLPLSEMEYFPGQSLQAAVDRAGPLPVDRMVRAA